MYHFDPRFNHILIIGNGFDLNLGLATAYSDFLRSDHYRGLKADSNALAIYLSDNHLLNEWIDIENELKSYSKKGAKVSNFKTEFQQLSASLVAYLKDIKYPNFDKNSHAYKLLESVIGQEFLIFDFNYTNTTEIILKELGVEENEIKDRLLKVHGSIKNEKIIFGVEDGADIDRNHIFLLKSVHRDYTGIDLHKQIDTLTDLYILGHSLGETDQMYFKDFFYSLSHGHANAKTIHLYYYKEEGWLKLHSQLNYLTNQSISGLRQKNDYIQIDSSENNQ